MELSARKKDVLKVVVQKYIKSGEPIGSKSMCDALGGISSATIRNEMSSLEELNLLYHPHTSAGRIPTANGFRFYIDNIMKPEKLSVKQKQLLDMLLPDANFDKKQAINFAATALSQATKCTALVTDETDRQTKVQKVEMVLINSNSVLLMLITSNSNVISRKYRFSSLITDEIADAFLRLVNNHITNEVIRDIQPAFLQTIVANSGQYALDIAPLVSALSELIAEAGECKLELFGEANLLSCANYSVLTAKEIFSLLTSRDEVLNLLEIWDKNSGVILGADTPYKALENASLVVSKYNLDGSQGYIGIIGPTRMDYDSIMPSIEYFADRLSNLGSYTNV